MKIAFVHDRLMSQYGAEKVFFELIRHYKPAKGKIFTLFSKNKSIEVDWINYEVDAVISNSFILDNIDYRNFMPLFPILTWIMGLKVKLYAPQITVISSFSSAKNIPFAEYKILYIHSPMQYIYDMYEENLAKLKGIKKIIYIISSRYIRIWDKIKRNYDQIYFNSNFTRSLCYKIYWQQGGKIRYPKINQVFLDESVSDKIQDYYCYVWRLVKFSKELEKIIELFNTTGKKLYIFGDGIDQAYLQSLANDNITFMGAYKDYHSLINVLKHAKGLVNLTKESFGMTIAESLAMWVPVFGFFGGACPELVDSKSWILVDNKLPETLLEEFKRFEKASFDRNYIKNAFLIKYDQHCFGQELDL